MNSSLGSTLFGTALAFLALSLPGTGMAASVSWTGGTSTTWSTGANWSGNAAPTSDLTSDIAVFDLASYPNLPSLTAAASVSGLQFGDAGGTATGAVTLGGSTLSLGGNGIVDYAGAGAVTIAAPLKLGASQTWTNNSSNGLTVTGTITNASSTAPAVLTLGGTGNTTLSGTVSNNGSGTLGLVVNTAATAVTTLSGSNTFTGGFTLQQGVVRATSSRNAIGASGNTPVTLAGGELQLALAPTASGTALQYNDPVTVTGNAQITLDLSSSGAGLNYVFGALSIGGQTLTLAEGSNIASGTPTLTFGATSLTGGASGTTILNVGTGTKLILGALGDGGTATTLSVTGGGAISLATAAAAVTSGTAVRIGASSSVALGNATALGSAAADVDNSGTLTLNSVAGNFLSYAGSGALVLSGSSSILTVNNAATTGVASGTISGTGGLIMNGTGKLSLSGANTYSGGTTVKSGTLNVRNASGSATGTGVVTVNGTSASSYGTLGGGNNAVLVASALGGATLKTYTSGAGSVTGAVTVNQFGHLAPGDGGVGTLTTNALTLASGSVIDFEFNATANDFVVSTALTLNGGSVNLFQEGTAAAFAAAGTYDLFQYTSLSGSVSNLSVANAQSGYSYAFSVDAADNLVQLTITAVAVPEPGVWALLGGGAAVLLLSARRRAAPTLA